MANVIKLSKNNTLYHKKPLLVLYQGGAFLNQLVVSLLLYELDDIDEPRKNVTALIGERSFG